MQWKKFGERSYLVIQTVFSISLLLYYSSTILTVAACEASCLASNMVSSDTLWHSQARKKMFRYIIVDNKVINEMDRKLARRTVGVLLDEEAFSEGTLHALFELVSKRFPEPYRLEISVYTSLKQLKTPEEAEAGLKSESTDDNAEFHKHYWAVFVRSQDDIFFRYNAAMPSRDIKTVRLK